MYCFLGGCFVVFYECIQLLELCDHILLMDNSGTGFFSGHRNTETISLVVSCSISESIEGKWIYL